MSTGTMPASGEDKDAKFARKNSIVVMWTGVIATIIAALAFVGPVANSLAQVVSTQSEIKTTVINNTRRIDKLEDVPEKLSGINARLDGINENLKRLLDKGR